MGAGGKRPILFQFHVHHGAAMGIHETPFEMIAVITDLRLNIRTLRQRVNMISLLRIEKERNIAYTAIGEDVGVIRNTT